MFRGLPYCKKGKKKKNAVCRLICQTILVGQLQKSNILLKSIEFKNKSSDNLLYCLVSFHYCLL